MQQVRGPHCVGETMTRRRPALVAALALLPALPATAFAAQRPAVLPAVQRGVAAERATAQRCDAPRRTGRGLATATWRAPMSGFVDVRLRGRGDWDLLVRDAASGR